MYKIKKLLEKHKNNIAKGYDNIEFRELSGGNFRLYLRNKPGDVVYISFCEILFSTPFLSLLEWKETSKEWQKGSYFYGINDCEWRKEYSETGYNFHKINLALLESDKERVDYIESFTL